ncbi:MAG: hypothetical protein AAB652_00735 [Patescibacteria group bacterium]
MKNYWFRPKRFWRWFAAYYPASWQGWIATLVLAALLVAGFLIIDSRSHSGSDTLLGVAPFVIAIFLVFDLLCFRMGEYPSWWKKRNF